MSVAPEIPYNAYEPMMNMILTFLFAALIAIIAIFIYTRKAANKMRREGEIAELERLAREEANKEEEEPENKLLEEIEKSGTNISGTKISGTKISGTKISGTKNK